MMCSCYSFPRCATVIMLFTLFTWCCCCGAEALDQQQRVIFQEAHTTTTTTQQQPQAATPCNDDNSPPWILSNSSTPHPPPPLPPGTTYGLRIQLVDTTPWLTLHEALRSFSCSSEDNFCRAPVVYFPTSTADSCLFLVAVSEEWLLYNAVSVPDVLLDKFNITSIDIVGPSLPEITRRGKHLVQLELWNPVLAGWQTWPNRLRSMLPAFGFPIPTPPTIDSDAADGKDESDDSGENYDDVMSGKNKFFPIHLVNASRTTYVPSKEGYVTTVIVSMCSVSLQIEVSSVNYSDAMIGVDFGGILAASIYPLGRHSSENITRSYENRVRFEFETRDLYPFALFSRSLETVFNFEANMLVLAASMTLVNAKRSPSNAVVLGQRLRTTFTVSFKTTNQQQKIIAISKLKDGFEMMDANGKISFLSAAAVPSPGPTHPPTPIPEPWGEGYILADLFSSSDCSGPAMPAAINSGCAEGSMFMCVDEHTIRIRAFDSADSACESKRYNESTVQVGHCLPTTQAGDGLYMKIKGCAPLGRVPKQNGAGVCMDGYDTTDCAFKILTSICYETGTCLEMDFGTASLQFSCFSLYGTYETVVWSTPTCQGKHATIRQPSTAVCTHGTKVRSCSSLAPSTAPGTSNATTNVTTLRATKVDQDQQTNSHFTLITLCCTLAFFIGLGICVKLCSGWKHTNAARDDDDAVMDSSIGADSDDVALSVSLTTQA